MRVVLGSCTTPSPDPPLAHDRDHRDPLGLEWSIHWIPFSTRVRSRRGRYFWWYTQSHFNLRTVSLIDPGSRVVHVSFVDSGLGEGCIDVVSVGPHLPLLRVSSPTPTTRQHPHRCRGRSNPLNVRCPIHAAPTLHRLRADGAGGTGLPGSGREWVVQPAELVQPQVQPGHLRDQSHQLPLQQPGRVEQVVAVRQPGQVLPGVLGAERRGEPGHLHRPSVFPLPVRVTQTRVASCHPPPPCVDRGGEVESGGAGPLSVRVLRPFPLWELGTVCV